MKKFALCAMLAVSCVSAYAEDKITVAYTGSTYGAVFADGDMGGIARRATAVVQLRKDAPDAILLDAGDFSAGGPFDPQRPDEVAALERTKVAYAAFATLGYDAYAIGENDGAMLAKAGIKGFLASNAKDKRAQSTVIKTVAGKKVCIGSLLPVSLTENKIAVRDTSYGMEQIKKEMQKAQAEYLIVITGIPYDEIESLAAKHPEIDMVIMTKASYPFFEHKKIGATVVVTPFFMGKSLGAVTLIGENGSVKDYVYRPVALDAKVASDKQVAATLPACFADADCPAQTGRRASCDRSGKVSACAYGAPQAPQATVITLAGCKACDVSSVSEKMKEKFPGLTVTQVDKDSDEAKELIKRFGARTLPLFVFSENLDLFPAFEEGRDYFVKRDGKYLLKPDFGGIFYFLDRKKIDGRIDAFLDIFAADSQAQLAFIMNKAGEKRRGVALHLVTEQYDAAKIEEIDRVLAVRALYPEKEVVYVQERMKAGIASAYFDDVMNPLGIDPVKIREYVRSEKILAARDQNQSLIEELRVAKSGVLLIDNVRIFMMIGTASGDTLDGYLE